MTRSTSSSWRATALLALLFVVLAFAFQGTRGLWEPDEGRYTNVALQMLASDDYLAPALNDLTPHFAKPPLTYWLIAGAVRAFGYNTWAVRTPYALAFVLTSLPLLGMGKRVTPRARWLPAFIYATSVAPFLAANIVSTDVFLTLFEATALYCWYRFVGAQVAAFRQRWQVGMWAAFGLAFLTKGPPGLLPLLAIFALRLIQRRRRELRGVLAWPGLFAFAVIGLSWYAAVIARDPHLLDYFLRYEVIDRIFTDTQHRNGQWYGWLVVYLPTFLIGALPWWPTAAWRYVHHHAYAGQGEGHPHDTWRLFNLLWLLIPLVVFILARSRLPLYVLPLFLPLSLLLASVLQPVVELTRPHVARLSLAWIIVLLAFKGSISEFAHPGANVDDARMAVSIEQAVAPWRYRAIVFAGPNMMQGLRLYLRRPIYTLDPAARTGTDIRPECTASAFPQPFLVVVPPHEKAVLAQWTAKCPGLELSAAGTASGRDLLLVDNIPGNRPYGD